MATVREIKDSDIRRSNPDEQLAIRTFANHRLRLPQHMLANLGWVDDTDYHLARDHIPDPRPATDETTREWTEAPVLRKGGGTTRIEEDRSPREEWADRLSLRLVTTDATAETWPFTNGDEVTIVHHPEAECLSFHEPTDADYAALEEWRATRWPAQHGPRCYDEYERVTGLDVSDMFAPAAFKSVWFTDDWVFASVTYRGEGGGEHIALPSPILLLTRFTVGDAYGLAYHERADHPCWYLCPPGEGQMTATISNDDSLRLQARELPFEGTPLHVTFDPTSDTLLIYEAAESPFPNPDT